MLNKAILMGRLVRDPDLRHTGNNTPVASFTLAISRPGKDKGVDFIDIVAWDKKAEFVKEWFTKGQLMAVSGRIQQRQWQDKDGNKRTSFEIVAEDCYFAESKKERSDARVSVPEDTAGFTALDDDEDLPF